MKALAVQQVPAGGREAWWSEVKFDGYRVIVVKNSGRVELWSRNEKPLDYPELVPGLEALRCRSAVLDGEIVALDSAGRSSFQTLQGRDLGERPPIVLFLFDVLQLDGQSLVTASIEERRAALEKLVRQSEGPIRLSPVFDRDPALVWQRSREQGLEGVILKRRGSCYEVGRRSGAWLKLKNVNEQEFVIGGFTPPRRTREHFGAILVGYFAGSEFRYAGKVGSGFDQAALGSLYRKFLALRTHQCPFTNLPLPRESRFGTGMNAAAMREVTWVKPRLVAQIRFAEWTEGGLLRQPVFLGLRKDKPAREVRRERAITKRGHTTAKSQTRLSRNT